MAIKSIKLSKEKILSFLRTYFPIELVKGEKNQRISKLLTINKPER
jgi:hypothetical protein